MKTDTCSVMLEIETNDRKLEWDLLGSPKVLLAGVSVTLPDGSVLAWQPGILRKGHGFPQVIRFVLTVGRDVGIGVLGNYIYGKLRDRATKLRVDREEIQIEEGEIVRIITEHIEEK